jgi:hypothetical protein
VRPTLVSLASAAALCACSGPSSTPGDAALRDGGAPACSLTPAELARNREQLLPGLIERAEKVVDLEDGLRLRFASRPGLLAELARVIDQERTCCSFLRFQVVAEAAGGPVTFDVTGPPGTRELLRGL